MHDASISRARRRVAVAPDVVVLHSAELHLGANHSMRNTQRLAPFAHVFREQLVDLAASTPLPELTMSLWLEEARDAEFQSRYKQRLVRYAQD